MRKPFIIACLLLFTCSAFCQNDSLVSGKKGRLYPTWATLIPGGTHFYDGNIAAGAVFSALEAGGLAIGIACDDQLKNAGSSPYYNFPLLIGMQAYTIDKLDLFSKSLAYRKSTDPYFRYDPLSYNDLLKAPFKPKNIFTPITGGMVALALAELYLSGRKSGRYYTDVSGFSVMGHAMNRNPALAIYGAVSLGASFGAGVSEEYIFRNGFLPAWDYKYGQKKGLIYSSLFFGSMHFTNLFMSKKPDIKGTLLQVAEATVLGYAMGADVQNRGYRIGPSVAAHMWYDFTLMLGSFLIDPENNFIGANVSFKI